MYVNLFPTNQSRAKPKPSITSDSSTNAISVILSRLFLLFSMCCEYKRNKKVTKEDDHEDDHSDVHVEGKNAQHSRQYTQKSEDGVKGGLSKVSHLWVLPLLRSPSNQRPNWPPPAPITSCSLEPWKNQRVKQV